MENLTYREFKNFNQGQKVSLISMWIAEGLVADEICEILKCSANDLKRTCKELDLDEAVVFGYEIPEDDNTNDYNVQKNDNGTVYVFDNDGCVIDEYNEQLEIDKAYKEDMENIDSTGEVDEFLVHLDNQEVFEDEKTDEEYYEDALKVMSSDNKVKNIKHNVSIDMKFVSNKNVSLETINTIISTLCNDVDYNFEIKIKQKN